MKWSTFKIRAWMEQRHVNSKFSPKISSFIFVYLQLSAVTSEQQIK